MCAGYVRGHLSDNSARSCPLLLLQVCRIQLRVIVLQKTQILQGHSQKTLTLKCHVEGLELQRKT